MKSFILASLLLLLLFLYLPAQNLKLGDTEIKFTEKCYGNKKSDVVFLNLHENENISVDAAKEVLQTKQKYCIITVSQSADRNLFFYYKKKKYNIDPNRIFSKKGIKKTLIDPNLKNKIENKTFLSELIDVVDQFAQQYLTNYINGKKTIIALHNNTPNLTTTDALSIYYYAKDGKEFKKGNTDTTVENNPHINPKNDIDDFFLTNDNRIFDELIKKNYNVVLQSKNAEDDGSLSVYSDKKGIKYVNVEAELNKTNKDKLNLQKTMISDAISIIENLR